MKKFPTHVAGILAALAAVLLCDHLLETANSREAAQPKSPDVKWVGVIDVSRVFRESKELRAALDELRQDIQKAEEKLRSDWAEIEQQRKELARLRDKVDAQELDEKLVLKETQFQLRKDLARREFLEREASHRHKVYTQMKSLVSKYSRNRGIYLVLRSDDWSEDDGLVCGVSREIPRVVFSDGVDITNAIIKRMNEEGGKGPIYLPPR